ncbi:SDR family NAD(P)-dependent oxidoreductase [Prescottella soli]|uniref:SDR family NAD(P)-dependent oxidoreductase n=1 Tax=Prescottella soli TaxID=1543852 RepID=A0ABW9FNM0_9NOCA
MKNLRARYGPYALVTGASAGIGAEFAAQLAAAGFDLVLVARRKERLSALADRLLAEHGTVCKIIELDLGSPGAVGELSRRTQALDIGLVVAAAGVLTAGRFLDNPLDAETALVELNLVVPLQLAHAYGRRFSAQGRGAVILIASTVAFAPAPGLANYAAAKAYIASFGQALNYELRHNGVDVLTLAPGPTRTEGVDTAEGIDFTQMPLPMAPAGAVVGKALRNLGRKPLVIPGRMNKISDFIGKYATPRRMQTIIFGQLIGRATTSN